MGVPSEIIVDNEKQFDNQEFRDFCVSIGTSVGFTSVNHPWSNGVVERTNGKIFTAIKKRLLKDKKGKWADQLLEVLWGLNTMESQGTGFTPFRLMYGAEAMIPQELKHGSPRRAPNMMSNIDETTTKDLLDRDRMQALDSFNKYQATTRS